MAEYHARPDVNGPLIAIVNEKMEILQRRCRAAGFTLIEVLVALTLLVAVAGGVVAAQGAGARLARDTLDRENAFWLARSRLFEAAAYADRSPPEDNRPDQYDGVDFHTRIEYRNLSPDETIALDELPAALQLIEIRVIVEWGAAPPRRVQLTSYRSLQPAVSAVGKK
jgi:prepilin-type N-terminal cleavage/methylation domain-containing protein